MDNNPFAHLNTSEAQFKNLLNNNGYACNADGRKFMTEHIKVQSPRPIPTGFSPLIAETLGGCQNKAFPYPTPYGCQFARTVAIENLPDDMVNPFLVCFSGYITAPLYAMEIIRFYAKATGKLLPFLAIGKGGNKGLFEKVYNRPEGIVRGSEYEAYLNIMEKMAPSGYVRKYQQVFNDMDTQGNLRELYRFAKEQKLDEITFVLCTGQAWYDQRVLAEWMLMLSSNELADIKINLVSVHCPIWLQGNTPDSTLSEISLGYMAASIGPLIKDTIDFDGHTTSEHPERYLMPGAKTADWNLVKDIIINYSNMGWPNYQELLYGIEHKQAVKNIILAHLFAEASFTAEDYDQGILKDIALYQQAIGKFEGESEKEFISWCINSTDKKFF